VIASWYPSGQVVVDDGRPPAQHMDELRSHIDAPRMKRIQA
jgi:hypothetical protein